MLTLFTTCKPFIGHAAVIQRNAIVSWTLLRPRPEIIVVGDEIGAAEICDELGLKHLPKVERASSGRPLFSSIFRLAEQEGSSDWLCYANSDVIFMGDFARTMNRIVASIDHGLVVARRWDADVRAPIDFQDPKWEQQLRSRLVPHRRPWRAVDFWVYHRHALPPMPDFVIGRNPGPDGWWIYTARQQGMLVIDASLAVTAVHQMHAERRYLPDESVTTGGDVRKNLDLTEKAERVFFIADATRVWTKSGMRPALSGPHIWRRLYTFSVIHPKAQPIGWALDIALAITRPIRKRLGWSV
jgi:hypothetical protein